MQDAGPNPRFSANSKILQDLKFRVTEDTEIAYSSVADVPLLRILFLVPSPSVLTFQRINLSFTVGGDCPSVGLFLLSSLADTLCLSEPERPPP